MPDGATVLTLGVSHHTADAAHRGRAAFTDASARAFLSAARERGRGTLDELLVLSTCNRVELHAVTTSPERAERTLRMLVEEMAGFDAFAPVGHRYRFVAEEACRHLARVACGLDSLVLGEAEILGQVRAAAALARDAGVFGLRLDRVVTHALRAGGRARSETPIGIGSTSVATAAVALGERVLRGLAGKRVVIVGAGQAGRLALSRVLKRRPTAVTMANRTLAHAEAAVAATSARACGLHELPHALADADLVLVAAHAAGGWVLPAAIVAARPQPEPAQRARTEGGSESRRQRLVVVDIAMPAGVEPAVRLAPGVRVFGLDELRGVVDETRRRRLAVVPLVEAIAADEAARAWRWWQRRGDRAEAAHGESLAHAGHRPTSLSL